MNVPSRVFYPTILGLICGFLSFLITAFVSMWLLLFVLPSFLDSFNSRTVRIPRVLIWLWNFLDFIYALPGLGPLLGMLLLSVVIACIVAFLMFIWVERISTPDQVASHYIKTGVVEPTSLPILTLPLRRETIETDYDPKHRHAFHNDEDDNSWAESLVEEYEDGGVPNLPPLDVYNDHGIQELREMVLGQLQEYRVRFANSDEYMGVTRQQWLIKHQELAAFLDWLRSDYGEKVRRKTRDDIVQVLEHYLVWEWV